jgi:hypothetical protein
MSRQLSVRTGLTSEEIKQDFRENVRCGLGRLERTATTRDLYYALALTIRDRVFQRTIESMESYGGANARRVAYLSAEYLPGPHLANNLLNLGITEATRDDVVGEHGAKLCTTREDTLEVARRLNPIGGRYLLAATFGNVHGVYKLGHVKLRPKVLKECQDAVVKAHGEGARFYLVFHGGSGSALSEIHEALDYGVVKMNVDTDMQYAFTRAVAGHMFKKHDGVLKVDGEVGNKKVYDPRLYLALAEAAMAERVKQAVSDLRGNGKTMFAS